MKETETSQITISEAIKSKDYQLFFPYTFIFYLPLDYYLLDRKWNDIYLIDNNQDANIRPALRNHWSISLIFIRTEERKCISIHRELLSHTCTMTYINPSISTCEWNPQEDAGKQSGDSYLLHFCKLQEIPKEILNDYYRLRHKRNY